MITSTFNKSLTELTDSDEIQFGKFLYSISIELKQIDISKVTADHPINEFFVGLLNQTRICSSEKCKLALAVFCVCYFPKSIDASWLLHDFKKIFWNNLDKIKSSYLCKKLFFETGGELNFVLKLEDSSEKFWYLKDVKVNDMNINCISKLSQNEIITFLNSLSRDAALPFCKELAFDYMFDRDYSADKDKIKPFIDFIKLPQMNFIFENDIIIKNLHNNNVNGIINMKYILTKGPDFLNMIGIYNKRVKKHIYEIAISRKELDLEFLGLLFNNCSIQEEELFIPIIDLYFKKKNQAAMPKVLELLRATSTSLMGRNYNSNLSFSHVFFGDDKIKALNYYKKILTRDLVESRDMLHMMNELFKRSNSSIRQSRILEFVNLFKEKINIREMHNWLIRHLDSFDDCELHQNPVLEKINNQRIMSSLKILVPNRNHQLSEFGNKMNICVGKGMYLENILRKECSVLFIVDNKNNPLYCIELDKNFKIIQAKGRRNRLTPFSVDSQLKQLISENIIGNKPNFISKLNFKLKYYLPKI